MRTPGETAPVEELDRRFVFHPFTQLDQHAASDAPVIVEGDGATLRDSRGRAYLDAMAGLWCVNIGYGRRELAQALHDEALRLGYYHAFSSMATDLPAQLAERVIARYPVPMSRIFFGSSGSDANDTQVKLVWYYNNVLGRTAKKKIVSRRRGYHGVTALTAGLTGLEGLHKGFDLPLPMIRHTAAPHRLWGAEPGESDEDFAARLADELERLIVAEGPDTVAAFIAEPLQGAGGVIVPPCTYWERIQAVLREYDVLERDGLVEQAAARGEHLHARLREAFADHSLVGEVRGLGLIAAVEFVAAKTPARAFEPALKVGPRIAKRCLELGLITRALPAADTIAFSPPFVVSEAELDEMVSIARRAADELEAELRHER